MANPAIIVDFIANTDKTCSRVQGGRQPGGGFGDKVKSLGKTAVVAGGAAGFAALAATVKVGIDEMRRGVEGARADRRRRSRAPAGSAERDRRACRSSPGR